MCDVSKNFASVCCMLRAIFFFGLACLVQYTMFYFFSLIFIAVGSITAFIRFECIFVYHKKIYACAAQKYKNSK